MIKNILLGALMGCCFLIIAWSLGLDLFHQIVFTLSCSFLVPVITETVWSVKEMKDNL